MTQPTPKNRRQGGGILQQPAERFSGETGADALKKQIFQQRADYLSRRSASGHIDEKRIPVLEFSAGKENWAIELSSLSEVLPLERLSRVPHAADWIQGIMNVKGDIIGVMDLKILLSLPATEISSPGYVLILKHSDMGLSIDRIGKIAYVASTDIVREEGTDRTVSARFIKCVLPGYILLLDADKILDLIQTE